MSAVTIQLPPETEQRLREKASRSGKSLEGYIQDLVQTDARGSPADAVPGPGTSPADFDACLDELAAGLPNLPTLPADFSRADIYGEHD